MCIATPISVNAFLIDVSYSRATFSLEMLGSEHAIEDREITSRSRWVCWLKSTLGSRKVMCIVTPISVNTFLIDVSYSRATFSLEMLWSEHAIEDREITSRSRWVCWLKSTLGSRKVMCIVTPISVNTFLIDVRYSRATFSLEMLGSEHAIEDREITSRSRWVCWLKSTLGGRDIMCSATPITVNAFLIDLSYSRVTSVPSVPEMLGSEQAIEDREITSRSRWVCWLKSTLGSREIMCVATPIIVNASS